VQTLLNIGQTKTSVKAQLDIIAELSEGINAIYTLNNKMTDERAKANKHADAHKKAIAYCEKVKPLFDQIREVADNLERIIDDAEWGLPKYRELLSVR
jgi:glutamine synthetase